MPLKGLEIRASYDYMGKDFAQQTLAFYAGYNTGKVAVGAEYNQQLNYKRVDGHDRSGISLYGSYLMKKIRLFGRYDMLTSPALGSDTDPWNQANDGQVVIAGVEFRPLNGLIVTPNYQAWLPADKGGVENSVYLSFEIKF